MAGNTFSRTATQIRPVNLGSILTKSGHLSLVTMSEMQVPVPDNAIVTSTVLFDIYMKVVDRINEGSRWLGPRPVALQCKFDQ